MDLSIVLPIALFFGLLLIGAEIAYALCISGFVGLLLYIGVDSTMGFLQTAPLGTAASYTLTTIPMFLLMAAFAEKSGMIQNLFVLSERLLSRVHGGLSYAVVGASTLMGALSGDSIGTAGAMSRMAVPEMVKRGYSKQIALGSAAAAGTIAIMIPPSIALVLYGILTETSIAALLMAGIIPGTLTAVAYMFALYFVGRTGRHFPKEKGTRYSWTDKMRALGPTWPFLLVVAAVLGAIYGGFATATEAAALGALSTFLIWLFFSVRRGGRSGTNRLTPSTLLNAVGESVRTTATILFLVIGATLMGYFLTVTGVTRAFGDFLLGLDLAPIVVLLMILLMYLVLGAFLSQVTILVLTLPIIMPVIHGLGYDAVWFGVIVVKMAEIGLLTPPVGLNVYVAAGSVGMRVNDGFRGVLIFLAAEVVVVTLLVSFPELALFIPKSAGLM